MVQFAVSVQGDPLRSKTPHGILGVVQRTVTVLGGSLRLKALLGVSGVFAVTVREYSHVLEGSSCAGNVMSPRLEKCVDTTVYS